MKVKKLISALGVGIAVAMTVSCAAKDAAKTEDTTSTNPASGTGSTSATNKVASATSIADLKLAGALAIKLPEAFGGSASSAALRLLAGKKSSEACRMGETIKQATRSLGEVGGFFCHLEVEKDRIKFGKKYRIMTSMGEFARIFVDNSQAASGKLTVSFCQKDSGEGHSGKQFITIDSLSDAGPKGSILNTGAESSQGSQQSFESAVEFDMSVAGLVNVLAKLRHESSGQIFTNGIDLSLKSSGVSSLKLASKGSDSERGGTFFDRGAALFDAATGSALFQSKGSHQGGAYEFSRKAFFNSAGDTLAGADVGADLQPATTAMPSYLPDDFRPAAPTGWAGQDCADYEEDVTLDPMSASHAACDQDHDEGDGCWDPSKYEDSNESVTVE